MGGDLMAREWDVPGYTEVKTLGSGGFGDVVLARHDASGTAVAIKYLRPQLLADPEFAELFRAEAVPAPAHQAPVRQPGQGSHRGRRRDHGIGTLIRAAGI